MDFNHKRQLLGVLFPALQQTLDPHQCSRTFFLHQEAATSATLFFFFCGLMIVFINRRNWRKVKTPFCARGHAATSRFIITRQAHSLQKWRGHNGDLPFYLAQTYHPVRRSGSPMIIITSPNPLGLAHSRTHTYIPALDKYATGNYSGEACLSGAVRAVIARGMVGYREANRAASATLAVASDFDYKERGERWRLSPHPFSCLACYEGGCLFNTR